MGFKVESKVPQKVAEYHDGGPPDGVVDGGIDVLPAPSDAGFDTAETIATLIIESNFSRRKAAREDRGETMVEMATAQKEELEHMREAADAKYTSAVTQAWVQIGTGAVTLGSMAAMHGGDALRNAPLHDYAGAAYRAMNDGGTRLADGVGKLATAGLDHRVSDEEAAAKAAGHAADRAKLAAEELRDDETAAMQSIDKTIGFLKEYEGTASQARSAALYKF